ncbi:hypothetical protein L7F22_060298 [Adiantum nelumboides]|nr:hypothetical protein [Adiantum nelumboides]
MERRWWPAKLTDTALAVGILAFDRAPPPPWAALTPSADGAGAAARPQSHVAASRLDPRNCGVLAPSCPTPSANP